MKGESQQSPKKKWNKKKIVFRILIFFGGILVGVIAMAGLIILGLITALSMG